MDFAHKRRLKLKLISPKHNTNMTRKCWSLKLYIVSRQQPLSLSSECNGIFHPKGFWSFLRFIILNVNMLCFPYLIYNLKANVTFKGLHFRQGNRPPFAIIQTHNKIFVFESHIIEWTDNLWSRLFVHILIKHYVFVVG